MEELPQDPKQPQLGPYWILIALVIGVLILATLTFLRPIAGSGPNVTPADTTASLTPQGAAETEVTGELTPTATEAPPTPEDIGYTDGIIFCSSVLVLILLVGTLREVVRRRGH
ncbi:MAG: hypothetical protein SVR81_07220 [Chloroflexota bacterium]|nr:hypothetical protein [Chloroflexota bacterium]